MYYFKLKKGYATRLRLRKGFGMMHPLDAIFAMLKPIVDDEIVVVWHSL